MTVNELELPFAPDAARDHAVLQLSAPPPWLTALALGLAAGVMTFGLAGLLLAINGWYHPIPAFALGFAGWVGVMVAGKPLWAARGAPGRFAHVVAAVGVFAVLAVVAWNASNVAQHVLINRDGGSYANTARWIARDGSLEVDVRSGPLAREPEITFDSYAVYRMPNGRLEFQFAHLLPVVLAEAHALAGDRGMFHAPAVLGGIALLTFFVLLWRVTRRPLPALAGMLALAFIVPQVSFARDSYSELPSQIFVFAGLACLVGGRYFPSARVAFVAGCFLGAIQATRIDGVAFLVAVPVLLAGALLAARAADRRAVAGAVGAFLLGLVPGLTIGLIDLSRHSGRYWTDLGAGVRPLWTVLILLAAVSLVVIVRWPAWSARILPLFRTRTWFWLAGAAAVGVVAFGFAAWLLRPSLQTAIGRTQIPIVGGLQAAEGDPINSARRYSEFTMVWMAWYLGAATLAAAILGAGLAVRSILVGRGVRVLAVVCVLVPPASVYLLRPRAVPDHIWVTRRYLVATFPLLILLAMLLVAALLQMHGRGRPVAIGVAAVIAVLAVAYPIYTVQDVREMSEQRRFLGVVNDACAAVGPDAVVIVLENEDPQKMPLFDDWVPQALRSWCGADVGVLRGELDAETLTRVADKSHAAGRTPFVVAASAETIRAVLPAVATTDTRLVENDRLLEATLTHRPDEYRRQSFAMAIAQIPIG